MQAEVVIPGPVGVGELTGIVVRTDSQARAEVARLKMLNMSLGSIPILVAPALFDRDELRNAIWSGRRPTETRFVEANPQ